MKNDTENNRSEQDIFDKLSFTPVDYEMLQYIRRDMEYILNPNSPKYKNMQEIIDLLKDKK
jgi:hypothetical protein